MRYLSSEFSRFFSPLTVQNWLDAHPSVSSGFVNANRIFGLRHIVQIDWWNEDKVFVARYYAVHVLVRILVHRCDGPFVAHPKVDGVRLFVEHFFGKIQRRQVDVVEQFGKIGNEVGILALDVLNGAAGL